MSKQGAARVLGMGILLACVNWAQPGSPGIPLPKDSRGVPIAREVKFEVLSIRPIPGLSAMNTDPRPNGFASGLSVYQMLMVAYGPVDVALWGSVQILNAPGWVNDFYDVNGRVSQADLKAWQNQSSEHELLRSAMRAALKERFRLAIHEQASKGEIFELVIGKSGSRLKATAPGSVLPNGVKLKSGGVMVGSVVKGKAVWDYHQASMEDLAEYLSLLTRGIPVRDRTGLTGRYDFTLRQADLSPDEDHVYRFPIDQLGLKLKPGTENRPNLVVDHLDKPTAN
jgi:uncharacterized protein (TIGR03435 family)